MDCLPGMQASISKNSIMALIYNVHCWTGASISRNLWGVQLNNQNFFGKISGILLALLVIVDFVCIDCLYVAIAHLMQFFFVFFLVLSRLENKRTVFWKRKNKTHLGQKWVGGGERVSKDI